MNKLEKQKIMTNFVNKIVSESEEIDPEINELVNNNYWELF